MARTSPLPSLTDAIARAPGTEPVAVIAAEDGVWLAETLAHHLRLGFAAVIVLLFTLRRFAAAFIPLINAVVTVGIGTAIIGLLVAEWIVRRLRRGRRAPAPQLEASGA